VIAVGIIIVGLLFGAVTLNNPLAFLGYVVGIGAVFSLLGILVGLWAEGFEQLSALNIFVITPLTYLGGVFYSITMLPEKMQVFTHSNPFFYFVDGLRSTMVGVSEANTTVGLVLIVGLVFFLGWLVMHLLRIGWKIRP
ncbi:ABC transporter permease, partial [Candidatus Kaiserbacteria bacterium]|nr:ABC transporter permease [Candidatus Kaiserbacteria bacterium]